MPRFAESLISRIKQDVSLLRVIEAKGYTPKRQGKDYAMRCPFHDDDTPSLIISPDTNLWHCMGACQKGGSVIDWLMQTEGVSFKHAVELLKNDLPHLAQHQDDDPKVVKRNSVQKLPSPLTHDADQQTLLHQVIDYYHATLKQSSEALDYLSKRGLNHPDLIDTFKLGYANRTLAYRLPQKNRQAGDRLRHQLQTIGILRDSGHEHFNGCLVIPIVNEQGMITEVYGRKLLGNRLRKGTPQHLYLPGPHHGVWNHQALAVEKTIILCESLIDAMTFWCAGFRNVITSYGTAGFTGDHLNALKHHQTETVYIAYDRDEAGNTAAEKLSNQLNQLGIDTYRCLFPKGMDANDYALKVQPANKSLGLVLRKAEWMGNGQHAAKRKNNANDFTPLAADLSHAIPSSPNDSHAIEKPAAKEKPNPTENTVTVDTIEAKQTDHEIHIPLDDCHYRIRGFNKNLSYEQLKINVLIRHREQFYVDTFDLYSARHRAAYIKQAAYELGLDEDRIKKDLGKVLLKLEALQDALIQQTLAHEQTGPRMSDAEVNAALNLLKDPALIERILSDFNHAGIVGEETNKLVGYLAACSRKLDKPLAVLIQSTSAAGKTSLMDAILSFMPDEERIQYSAMTGQSLFYMGETDLKHKILAIAEEEGAHNTSYALKLLQSEGEVTIASTGKNATTGNLETQQYRVEGPVALFSTTTAIDIDEELLNRCIVLTVDETRAQTQAIHAMQRQRRTLQGLQNKLRQDQALQTHRHAQQLLKPLKIINPYADQLTFLDDKTRTRRDHEKYLSLIDTIALLHQYQRPVKKLNHNNQTLEYIEVTLNDIQLANQLAHDVLGRTLDELPPQTRKLLHLIHAHVQAECNSQHLLQSDYRFSRKTVRHLSGWTDFQIKKHMRRLEDLEYVLVHSGGRGKSIVYEMLYQGEGREGDTFLMGLVDTAHLQSNYDAQKEPLQKEKQPPSRPRVAAKSPLSRDHENDKNAANKAQNETPPQKPNHEATKGKNNGASYRSDVPPLAASSR